MIEGWNRAAYILKLHIIKYKITHYTNKCNLGSYIICGTTEPKCTYIFPAEDNSSDGESYHPAAAVE